MFSLRASVEFPHTLRSGARRVRAAAVAAVLLLVVAGCDASGSEEPPRKLPDAAGPAISPLLVGNNVWLNPSAQVWDVSEQAGLRLVRIGGIRYDNEMPSLAQLTEWINRIKAMNAEPMIQVSRHDGPEAAAAIVRHFNKETNNRVTYWNIGNEPHCGENDRASALDVAAYVKSIAPAMKAVDPSIRIFAPDECDYLGTYYGALFSGNGDEADISGKVPGEDDYYVDGVSWHRYVGYPPGSIPIDRLTTDGAADFRTRIERTRDLVDAANAAQGRTGDDALQWGIGEFNSSEGFRVCSFENGQMFALIYGEVMRNGGTYAATWSMYENGGSCQGTDYSFINNDMTPRSTLYHMQMISWTFSGYYLEAFPNRGSLRAFASIDPERTRVSVMVLNLHASDGQTCTIRLSGGTGVPAGEDCVIDVPAEIDAAHQIEIGPQATQTLVFSLEGIEQSRTFYSRSEQWLNGEAPISVVVD